MEFKKWLLKLEVGDNPAGVNTDKAGDIGPDRRFRPNPEEVEAREKDPRKSGVIETPALPTFDGEPLPGNKRPMKKKMKRMKKNQ